MPEAREFYIIEMKPCPNEGTTVLRGRCPGCGLENGEHGSEERRVPISEALEEIGAVLRCYCGVRPPGITWCPDCGGLSL